MIFFIIPSHLHLIKEAERKRIEEKLAPFKQTIGSLLELSKVFETKMNMIDDLEKQKQQLNLLLDNTLLSVVNNARYKHKKFDQNQRTKILENLEEIEQKSVEIADKLQEKRIEMMALKEQTRKNLLVMLMDDDGQVHVDDILYIYLIDMIH